MSDKGGRHRRKWRPGEDDQPVTGVTPVDMPHRPERLAEILRGTGPSAVFPAGWCAPLDTVSNGTSIRLTTEPPPEHTPAAGPQAQAAEHAHTPVRPVRAGGIRPQWGCSTSAHEHLGWCSQCPGIDTAAEVMAWRLLGDRLPAPDVAWARLITGKPQ